MAAQATVYSPLIKTERGKISVEFSADHPGYHDQRYQEHRARIARAALDYRSGRPAPLIDYTDEEHEIWRLINAEFALKHQQYACEEFLEASERLALPTHRLPQLREASATIQRETGFAFEPAPGLVEQRDFYGSLADRRFQATQYIRHSSFPRFSPEPDMIHEIVGHGTHLCSPRWARLYELIGHTIRRLRTPEPVNAISRVFWFTVEYGLVRENGRLKACGASLLSSPGELEQFHKAEIRPLDTTSMAQQKYQVQNYQPVLYYAESLSHLEDTLSAFLTGAHDRAQASTA
ncbi:phenylalanine 4-monooxygenase [Streptomyces sp. P1-3]|uniref:phenylalanine 4-monooxygenase n=1 Tax=Streptomyces sp. P1-3 TaxID=3421658 RepID=UPI003D367C5F